MAVRSLPLAKGLVTVHGAGKVILLVEPNWIALVKDIRFRENDGLATHVVLYLNSGSPPATVLIGNLDMAAGSFSSVSGWMALGPGDSLVLSSSVSNIAFWVSGAYLEGAVHTPPTPPAGLVLADL